MRRPGTSRDPPAARWRQRSQADLGRARPARCGCAAPVDRARRRRGASCPAPVRPAPGSAGCGWLRRPAVGRDLAAAHRQSPRGSPRCSSSSATEAASDTASSKAGSARHARRVGALRRGRAVVEHDRASSPSSSSLSRTNGTPRRADVRQWMSRGSSPWRKSRSPKNSPLRGCATCAGRGRGATRNPRSSVGRHAHQRRDRRAARCGSATSRDLWMSPKGNLRRQPEARQRVAPAAGGHVAVGGLLRAPGRQLQEVAALFDGPPVDQVLDLDRERRQPPLAVRQRDPHQVGRAGVDAPAAPRAGPSRPRRQSSDSTPLARSRNSIIPQTRKSRLSPALMAARPTSRVATRNHQPSRVGGKPPPRRHPPESAPSRAPPRVEASADR